MRTKLLTPPDDPFLSYKKLVTSKAWPFPPAPTGKASGFTVPYHEDEGYALREILRLVRSVYRPTPVEYYVNGLDYEKDHKEFLALNCRWDPVKQNYVRK